MNIATHLDYSLAYHKLIFDSVNFLFSHNMPTEKERKFVDES